MSSFTARHSAFHPHGMIRREIGLNKSHGVNDALAKSLYCGMKPMSSWDCEQAGTLPTGGVFNLEFSPEGSLLVAACEKKSIQIFDPLTHKGIHTVCGAHTDCVNCVKFLDNRMFSTCSDDSTIALWDIRNLKKRILTLQGHSDWVKNIEFSTKDKLLVTSGLDGSIYTWDINLYTENGLVYRRVFHASDLMRCRLSPDSQQMVMCTTGGLLIIVHGLDLSELHDDLNGFKPNLYRLMQRSKQVIPVAAVFNHLFDKRRRRNRVEFVTDFPEGNDAEVVSSLQIHPQGWAALSRNISHDDKSEWTCIHDIQPEDSSSVDKSVVDNKNDELKMECKLLRRSARTAARYLWNMDNPGSSRSDASPAEAEQSPESSRSTNDSNVNRYGSSLIHTPSGEGADQERSRVNRQRLAMDPSQDPQVREFDEPRLMRDPVVGRRGDWAQNVQIQNDVWEASMTIKQSRILQAMASRGQVGRNFNMQHITGIMTGITATTQPRAGRARSLQPYSLSPPHTLNERPSTSDQTEDSSNESDGEFDYNAFINASKRKKLRVVRKNKERLLYYIEETNEARGFIKELCYSADGRIVCSPFGNGMRLLALNEDCMELSHCVDEGQGPKVLVEVGQSLGIHQDLVVSAKFSPRHHLLVTGCLSGKVVWYEPHSGETL